jgi:hypothetical protein
LLSNGSTNKHVSTATDTIILGSGVFYAIRAEMEAGSNISTVALRVVGGLQEPVAIVNDRPVLSSERALHINKPATV